ncbi:MAG: hypothetical protein DHS20C21_10830 [Gemmatimonadota bacterium]|nr:MAG: hypothetical protein DHS20C21_10830 [Gemmatimonadota bacterium]
MVFRTTSRKAPTALGLIALLLFLPGCPFSPESDKGGGGGGDDREPPRTSIADTIELYAYAWRQKRLDLYEQLLHEQFEYIPLVEDAADFGWIPEEGWGRTVELEISSHMFDTAFQSAETENSVDTIDMTLTITNERAVDEGIEVTTTADIIVLWNANDGLSSDVRFIFIVVEDPDEPGKFQIIRQEELEAF